MRGQPVKIIPSSSLITVQNLVTLSRVRTCRRSRKFRGCWDPAPLGKGRGSPPRSHPPTRVTIPNLVASGQMVEA